jgi:integrase
MVYNRVKYVFNQAGIKDASTHTLRKTAGAWYYLATRDIFATSRFLGHSSVKVTEKHYAGLIQSLQVEYSAMYESTLNSRLLLGCYFETKQDQSRPNLPIKDKPSFIVDK